MNMNRTQLREFVTAYMECALWSSTDDDGDPLDASYDLTDVVPTARRAMMRDCLNFIDANDTLLSQAGTPVQNGHDYWLTRNHHGAGFWDRGYGKVGDALTAAAHPDGPRDLYIGDDGRIYQA